MRTARYRCRAVFLIIGNRCIGLLDAVNEVYPGVKFQRCTVHFYRNMFSVTPRSKVKEVAAMLKAIHAQESKEAAREKAFAVVICARLRHVAGIQWGSKRYMSMAHLDALASGNGSGAAG